MLSPLQVWLKIDNAEGPNFLMYGEVELDGEKK